MVNMVTLLQWARPHVPATTLRPLSRIIVAMVVMTGRVTMLGLSRWAGKGGSDRTLQRLFATALPWATLLWVFFRHHIYRSEESSLLVGDEVVATKAGKHTYGLDRFFARLYGQPVPGLAFFTLSLVSTQQRRSFPLRVEQVVRSDAEKAASNAKAAAKQAKASGPTRRPGRPKGSKNLPKADGTFTPERERLTCGLDALLQLIVGGVAVTSVGLDGHFGNHHALRMARQGGLHLIAKRRCDAALSLPSTGPYAGRGPRRKYGHKVADDARPVHALKETTVEGHMQTCVYQMQLLHKAFTQLLPVVIRAKTPLRTQARAHVVLFSRDLDLAYTALVDYYGLRFQIEIV
jgi:putative transposase